jgi:hypothetical protein
MRPRIGYPALLEKERKRKKEYLSAHISDK